MNVHVMDAMDSTHPSQVAESAVLWWLRQLAGSGPRAIL